GEYVLLHNPCVPHASDAGADTANGSWVPGGNKERDLQLGTTKKFAHNLEVTRALTRAIRDARCSYDRSLDVLRHAKQHAPERLTKSSLMVGLGESDDEVLDAMRDLRAADVDIVTLGQYLRPTPKHAAVERYVSPEQFATYEREGLK